jgi:hypothetical protein
VFAKHGLNIHVFGYVKDEGSNLATMTSTLTFVMSCEVLGLSTPFVGSCWGHVMFKCYQYVIVDSKACANLLSISIKNNNQFCKKLLLGPRKVARDGKNGTKHVTSKGVSP